MPDTEFCKREVKRIRGQWLKEVEDMQRLFRDLRHVWLISLLFYFKLQCKKNESQLKLTSKHGTKLELNCG